MIGLTLFILCHFPLGDLFPCIEDLDRFPDAAAARRNWLLYTKHVGYLQKCREAYAGNPIHERQLDEWIVEADRCREVWSRLDDVHMYVANRAIWVEWDANGQERRFAAAHYWLRDLRWKLGWEDYLAGKMPPAFPADYQFPGEEATRADPD